MKLSVHDKVATTVALAVGVEIVTGVIREIAGEDISANIGDEDISSDALGETIAVRIQAHLGAVV